MGSLIPRPAERLDNTQMISLRNSGCAGEQVSFFQVFTFRFRATLPYSLAIRGAD